MIRPNDPTYPRAPGAHQGLDVRTYLAAAAMQGLAAGAVTHDGREGLTPDAVARLAVELADALLARLNGATAGGNEAAVQKHPKKETR